MLDVCGGGMSWLGTREDGGPMDTSEVASDECAVDDTGEDGELSKV